MRLLKPLLAGAALFALAAPALASAEPSYGDGGHEYHRNGYDNGRWRDGYAHRDQGYGGYGRRDYWDGRSYGYHHRWRMHRDWRYDRGW